MIDTQIQQEQGRAKNALQDYLIRKLLVPKIYLDADWNGTLVDVLAIDRAGVGDVHAVKLLSWEPGHHDDHGYSNFLERTVSAAMESFTGFPGHFKYLTVVCPEPKKQLWIPSKDLKNQSFAADGVGRIGIFYLDVTEENASVEVLLKAERFRSSKEIIELADRYVAEHTANWEIRE